MSDDGSDAYRGGDVWSEADAWLSSLPDGEWGAAYFADRTQSTNQQCPGRAADMSQEAAGAFTAAVKTVASKAEGGNKQPLLP